MQNQYIYASKSILKKRLIKLSLIQLLSLPSVDKSDIIFVIDVNEDIFNIRLDINELEEKYNNMMHLMPRINKYIGILKYPILQNIVQASIFYVYSGEKKAIVIKEFLLISELFCLHSYCPMIHKLIDKA